jgi:hypothetical protein
VASRFHFLETSRCLAFILALIPVLFASSIVENKLLSLLLLQFQNQPMFYRLKYIYQEKSRFEFYLELCFIIGANLVELH